MLIRKVTPCWVSRVALPLDRPIAEGGLDKGGADISDGFQEGVGGVFMNMGVVTSVFDEPLFDMDAERVDGGFVWPSQGEGGFCDGAVQFSFFDFV